MAGNLKDYATSLVVTAPVPATSGTTLVVTTGEGAIFPDTPFSATVHPAMELPTLDNAEKVTVTDITNDTLTITRSQGDTVAQAITTGWRISNSLFASDIESKVEKVTSTDNAITRFNGTAGEVQNSLSTVDDGGSINIPSGQSYKINGTNIINNTLTSTSTTEALSAAQGKVLNDILDFKLNGTVLATSAPIPAETPANSLIVRI